MNRFQVKARRWSATLIGLVFYVAGILKLMDPVGAGLVMTEYFRFFHLDFLLPAAQGAGIAMALLEAVTGAALITGVFRKVFAIVTIAMVAFFTGVTAILWLKNPAFDCGCFGEAIHLTHGQTLLKNLALLILSGIAFLPFRALGKSQGRKQVGFWLVSLAAVALVIYTGSYIPFKDFTPFNYSARLMAAEMLDPQTPQAESVTWFVYEKDGRQESFPDTRLPDSTWTFVRAETLLQGDGSDINRFPELPFTDADGNFCEERAADTHVLICSVPRPEKLDIDRWEALANTLAAARDQAYTQLLLVAAEAGSLAQLLPPELDPQARYTLLESAGYSDFRTLISLNRSNGGATYFHQGWLLKKWAFRKLPDKEELQAVHQSDTTEITIESDSRGKLWFQGYFFFTLAALFLL